MRLHGFISLLLTAGCATAPAVEDPQRLAAADERALCSPETIAAAQATVTPAAIESVEPIYAPVHSSRSGTESRMHGARLTVAVSPGMTHEWLERVLLCHEAERVTGTIVRDALPNDPFWLPEGWVNIEVRAERGRFVVLLLGNDITQSNLIYSRAKTFIAGSVR